MPLQSYDQKILRILRLRIADKPDYLGLVATRVGALAGNIGEITIVTQGPDFIVREISLQVDDQAHLKRIVDAVSELEGVEIEQVIDPVQKVHEGGKIAVRSRVPLDNIAEMRKIYTPGVAEICKLIQSDISLSSRYTSISNTVGIVTNGTAILGLGHIGPIAGMPVMEGKAVLFEQLVGISAVPILVRSTDVESVVRTVQDIASTFGAIQLEDIAAPECFEIERRLQAGLSIPVLHDDQHGTAVVVLAALLTIAQRIKRDLPACTVGLIGVGAAGLGIANLLKAFGVRQIVGTDLRDDAMQRLEQIGGQRADHHGVMKAADIVVATTGKPGVIEPEMVRQDQVILALSNPDPEIKPEVALSRGARFAADGRTINNALAFPGLFRGALRAGASCFTDAMKLAAAQAIAGQTKHDILVPSILDREVHQAVADAVERAWLTR